MAIKKRHFNLPFYDVTLIPMYERMNTYIVFIVVFALKMRPGGSDHMRHAA